MKIRNLVAGAVLSALVPSLAIGAPLLRYTFDESSGNAVDVGTAPHTDGVLTGGATRSSNTPSGVGSSLDLRNDSPYAHVVDSDAADLDGLGALTLSTWLNVEQYTSGNHRLAAKQAGGAFGGFSWNMNATPNDGAVGPDNFRLGLFLGNNVSSGASNFGAAFSSADVDAANKWVFLAVTYDNSVGSGNTKFYIGGVNTPVVQLGADQTLPQIVVDGGTARFGVGFTDAAPAANTSVIGLQDDVRVYGSALSLSELEAVRFEGVVPEPSAVVLGSVAALGVLLQRRRK